MGSAMFFARCMVITVILISLLQIRIGEVTLEERANGWIHQSPLVEILNESAQGGVKIVRDGWRKLTAGLNTKFWKQKAPGARELELKLQRSEKYLEEQTEKLKKFSEESGDSASATAN